MPEGDDLAISLFLLSLAGPTFGLEAMKAETIERRITFGFLAIIFLIAALFWFQIKKIWPPFTASMASIATNPLAWFVVMMFIFGIFAFHHPRLQTFPPESGDDQASGVQHVGRYRQSIISSIAMLIVCAAVGFDLWDRNHSSVRTSAVPVDKEAITDRRPKLDGSIVYTMLTLQLLFLKASESMGNHDSKVVDADSVD